MAAKRSSNALKWEFETGLRRDVWRTISRLRDVAAAQSSQLSEKKKGKSSKALHKKSSRKK